MIEFACSKCGKTLKVGDDTAGRRGKCPQCGNTVLVPQSDTVLFEPASPPPVPTVTSRPRRDIIQPPPLNATKGKHRLWLVILVVAALICIPLLPRFPLWLGIAFVSLCTLVFVPGARTVSYRLLRLQSGQKWRSGGRVIMYGLIGLVLILGGVEGAQYKAAEEKIAVEKAAEEAEQRRLAGEANQKVAEIAIEAEGAWKRGNAALTDKKLKEAEAVQHATDMGPVNRLHAQMANAKVDLLVADARKALEAGNLDAAKTKVQEALSIARADAVADAKKLESQIAIATDPSRVHDVLMALSDDEFSRLQKGNEVPAQLVTGYEGLDKRVIQLAQAQLSDAAAAREKLRQEQIERERLAAEAARKVEEERKAQEVAAAKAARKAEAEAARKAEEEIDVDGLVLLRKTVNGTRGEFDGEITGTVVNRRGRKLGYAQITFNLYDESGAQVGTALANINGLEPGGRWNFKATTFGTDFVRYKFSELSGF